MDAATTLCRVVGLRDGDAGSSILNGLLLREDCRQSLVPTIALQSAICTCLRVPEFCESRNTPLSVIELHDFNHNSRKVQSNRKSNELSVTLLSPSTIKLCIVGTNGSHLNASSPIFLHPRNFNVVSCVHGDR